MKNIQSWYRTTKEYIYTYNEHNTHYVNPERHLKVNKNLVDVVDILVENGFEIVKFWYTGKIELRYRFMFPNMDLLRIQELFTWDTLKNIRFTRDRIWLELRK